MSYFLTIGVFAIFCKITCIVEVDSQSNSSGESGEWQQADLTMFESYPTTSSECQNYSGCKYEGEFAFVNGKQTEEWVADHHIISVNKKDADQYKLKTFQITQGNNTIQAQVLDECDDDDCNGCCTQNSQQTGFLIDMEKYTYNEFGASDGIVQWKCIDC